LFAYAQRRTSPWPIPSNPPEPWLGRAAGEKAADRFANAALRHAFAGHDLGDRRAAVQEADYPLPLGLPSARRVSSRRRAIAAGAEFLALQVSRLNEALTVAYSAMSGANLQAVDRVVNIVRELDRYHGFAGADEALRPRPRRFAPPCPAPLALEAPIAGTEPNGAAND
jgi:hypothetical protein